jgi:hypothetical protein
MLPDVKKLEISALGQRLPAAVRRRRRARLTAFEDDDGGSISQAAREAAIEAAAGAFKDYPGPSTDEMLRLNREEERRAEERKFGPGPE